ncbi:hypothetical protein DBT_2384 [Dissulfuribacter thermophilus]|uniref:Uncharacterized protein n=1 Tax=Dissulfuribacter thermophilus TaxID=1156395 RepID=A0A1B9F2U1_9BACT|nr:hypothetical protein [Dissulfuribacter thermophilus]OCC14242.1 hypothetical protein DBT_2384 [Dissulfuribacter thermophilus]
MRNLILAVSCICCLILSMLSAGALESAAAVVAESSNLPDDQFTLVLDLQRPSDTDILLLRNGDRLTGTILNKSFSIRTSYAQLKFNNRMIAGINLEGGPNNIESIITVNNNLFSGFIDNAVFVFKLQSGPQINVRKEKVLKAVFRVRKAEREGIPQRQFIVLKNGDYFSGKLLNDKIVVATTYAAVPLVLSNIDRIKLIGSENPLTRVTMRNSDVIQGVLQTEDIQVKLDVGPVVGIYKDRIDMIYCKYGYRPEHLSSAVVQQFRRKLLTIAPDGAINGPVPYVKSYKVDSPQTLTEALHLIEVNSKSISVLILALSLSEISQDHQRALRDWVSQGGGIWLFYGMKSNSYFKFVHGDNSRLLFPNLHHLKTDEPAEIIWPRRDLAVMSGVNVLSTYLNHSNKGARTSFDETSLPDGAIVLAKQPNPKMFLAPYGNGRAMVEANHFNRSPLHHPTEMDNPTFIRNVSLWLAGYDFQARKRKWTGRTD